MKSNQAKQQQQLQYQQFSSNGHIGQQQAPLKTQKSSNNLNDDPSAQEQDIDSFKVYVRVRPLSSKEQLPVPNRKSLSIINANNNMIHVYDQDQQYDGTGKRDKSFSFNQVFTEEYSNSDVFSMTLKPLIPSILNGYNVTCFAYGMTGAGKTHTMIGHTGGSDIQQNCDASRNIDNGLCVRAVQSLFNEMSSKQAEFEYNLKISYLEIYNEQVRDLLAERCVNLMVVEDPVKGVIVPNLQEFRVTHPEQLATIITVGNQKRIMAPTAANQLSSRSHAILILTIEGKDKNQGAKEEVFYSKLQMIDLAGSERASTTENRGQRMVEGANINKSLLSLGNCINTLSDKAKAGSFVPYRDSKLTRLLKDSLGGNTKTLMIACVSPSFTAYEETVNTLKYASRARNIKKQTTRNVMEVEMHVSQYKDIIESMKTEIDTLKEQLKEKQNSTIASVSPIRSISVPFKDLQNCKDTTRNQPIHRAQSTRSGHQKYLNQKQTTPLRSIEHNDVNSRTTTIKYQQNQHIASTPICDDSMSRSLISMIDTTPNRNNFGEIEEQIFRTQKEKKLLEQQILSKNDVCSLLNSKPVSKLCSIESDLSGHSSEKDQIEQLSQNLQANFEEHWELKQSVGELEELQLKNHHQLKQLSNDLIELAKQQVVKANNPTVMDQITKVAQFKNNEMGIIQRNYNNNARILGEMKAALSANIEQKGNLQKQLLHIHSSKRKDILEVQIQMRNLKLEKTDLYLENLEMQKVKSQHEAEKKINDQKLVQMQLMIEQMQQKLTEKESIIQQNQIEIQKKDQELQKIKRGQSENQNTDGGADMVLCSDRLLEGGERDQFYPMPCEIVQSDISCITTARGQQMQPKLEEISKKLVLSGFFEDDYQCDDQDAYDMNTGGLHQIKPSEFRVQDQLDDLTQFISKPFSSKRQSLNNKKGSTPNNRYNNNNNDYIQIKEPNLNLSNISVNADNNQSDIFQVNDFFNCNDLQKESLAEDDPTPKSIQISLYTQKKQDSEKAKNNRYGKKQHSSNHNSEAPPAKTALVIQAQPIVKGPNAYQGRQQAQNPKRDSSKKPNRSQKLNRYLSQNRKAGEKETCVSKGAKNNNNNVIIKRNEQESEKENYYRNDLPSATSYVKHNTGSGINMNQTNMMNSNFKSLNIDDYNQLGVSNNIGTMTKGVEIVDMRSQLDAISCSNNFSSRKNSNINASIKLSNQKQPKREQSQISSNSASNSQVFSSYAEIRRASKERQLQHQQQQLKAHQSLSQQEVQQQQQEQQQQKSLLSYQQRQSKNSGIVNSYKAGLADHMNRDGYQGNSSKASAAALIGKYGPIRPTHSTNELAIGSNYQPSPLSNLFNSTQSNSQALSYFDNFVKKKGSFVNNFNTQPSSLLGSQRQCSSSNGIGIKAMQSSSGKVNGEESPLVHAQQHDHSQLQPSLLKSDSARQLTLKPSMSLVQTSQPQQTPTGEQTTTAKRQPSRSRISQQSVNSITNIDEILSQHQSQLSGGQQYQQIVSSQSAISKCVSKDIDSLISRQKEQLSRDREKINKNQTIFTNSFASTLTGVVQQPTAMTQRNYQSEKDENMGGGGGGGGGIGFKYSQRQQQRYQQQHQANDFGEDEFDEKALESPLKREAIPPTLLQQQQHSSINSAAPISFRLNQ